jgi:hypothetical protein
MPMCNYITKFSIIHLYILDNIVIMASKKSLKYEIEVLKAHDKGNMTIENDYQPIARRLIWSVIFIIVVIVILFIISIYIGTLPFDQSLRIAFSIK